MYYKFERLYYYTKQMKDFSTKEIAEKIGYTEDFFLEIIKGKVPISKNELKNILKNLEIKEKDFLTDDKFKLIKNDNLISIFNTFMDTLDKK